MNRTVLFRRLSLGLASLALAGASMAATAEDQQLSEARSMANTEAQVAVDLQAWTDERDIELLAQADGLVTNAMRAAAEEYAIAALAEADGLITTQLRERIEFQRLAELAMTSDGLIVDGIDIAASLQDAAPAAAAPGRVMVAATSR
ncbi:MAG: hypothetical protein KF891_05915 [Rhizobacter sp.]|nr:hypothetical protein [Rhizobacter sp.]